MNLAGAGTPNRLGSTAANEVQRSQEEQRVRDKLTAVRKKAPQKMAAIGKKLKGINLLKDGSLDTKVLTSVQIQQVESRIDNT